MSIRIDRVKCFGCVGLKGEARCTKACPGDLIHLSDEFKAVLNEARDCWDCMACVKACPAMAIECRLPYVVADYRAVLAPRVRENEIEWTVTDQLGNTESFTLNTVQP